MTAPKQEQTDVNTDDLTRTHEFVTHFESDGATIDSVTLSLPLLGGQLLYQNEDASAEHRRAWMIADACMLPHDAMGEMDTGDFLAILGLYNELSTLKQDQGKGVVVPENMAGVPSFDIPLFKPLQDKDGERTSLTMQRPKLKHQLKYAHLAGEAEKEVAMIGECCGLSPAQMDELAITDYSDLQKVYKGFLSSKRKKSVASASVSPSLPGAA